MKNSIKFKVSEDLQKILKKASESAGCLGLSEIPMPLVLYHLLDAYMPDRQSYIPINEWDQGLSTYVEKYLAPDKARVQSIRTFLTTLMKEISKGKAPMKKVGGCFKEFFGGHNTDVFSDEMDRIFDAAMTLRENEFKEREEKLYSDLLLSGILVMSDNPIHDALNNLIDVAKFKDSMRSSQIKNIESVKNLLENLFGGSGRVIISGGPVKSDSPLSSLLQEAINAVEKELDTRPSDKKDENKDNEGNSEGDSDHEKDNKEFEEFGVNSPVAGRRMDEKSKTPFLDTFSTDMTRQAKEDRLDPVIGREDEVNSIIEILCKRKKANVAVVGVAGSGKSSVVERLAQRIVSEEVPERLIGKPICSLNLNDLVAGTKYRGEYEERLQKIIEEVCENKNIIVYIDELHNLVGSGSSSGNGDGANILKPYLARGEFQCIGSTTEEEYRRFIEKDAALNRRFTQVEITEPTSEETVEILNGISERYQEFHRVNIGDGVLDACVKWSERYITDKHQPDKSIDLLDLGSALASLKTCDPTIRNKRKELEEIILRKIKAVTEDKDLELGQRLRREEEALRKSIDKAQNNPNRKKWPVVTTQDIAEAVSKISRVPVNEVNRTDSEKIKQMRDELRESVIGQGDAIDVITKNLQRSWLGLRQPNKPIFSGLFVGNTGTGKTLICKEVARVFFGGEGSLIKIDCGELRDPSSVSKLIGTTAGYVGYEDEPLLLQVKRTPSCLLLLDEIEKCDKSIYEIFMNILDEGYCVLGDGTRVDFTNAMIIFTGNVGTRELRSAGDGLGFVREDQKTRTESIVRGAIDRQFKPEFINRLNQIVVFNDLGYEEMKDIFDIELSKLNDVFSEKGINLKATARAKTHVLDLVDLKYGARDLKRLIDTWIVDPVSEELLENPNKTKFTVDFDGTKAKLK